MIESTENLISTELQVEPQLHGALKETARWAKFIAIAGFAFSTLILIAAACYLFFVNNALSSYRSASARSGAMLAVFFYVIIAIVWVIMSVIHLRFAVKMQRAIEDGNQQVLNESLESLKNYYRFRGIVTIITLLLSILGTAAFISTLMETYSRYKP